MLCCAFYHPWIKPILQQIRLLQVAKRYCRRRREVLLFAKKKNMYTFRVLPTQDKLVLRQDVKSCVWRDSGVILSNQETLFAQRAATWSVARQAWTWLVKRATSLFNSLFETKQVERFCCPFYHSLKTALFAFLTCFLVRLSVLVSRCVDFNLL